MEDKNDQSQQEEIQLLGNSSILYDRKELQC